MEINVHPNAEENFNNKALEVLAAINSKQEEDETDKKLVSPIEMYPQFNITVDQIVPGSFRTWDTNSEGNKTAFYFDHGGKWFGVSGSSFGLMCEVIEGVKNLEVFKDILGLDFVTEQFQNWLVSKYLSTDSSVDFIAYLKKSAHDQVEDRTVLVPISNLVISNTVEFGNVSLKPLSRSWFKSLRNRSLSNPELEDAEGIENYFDEIKNKHVGYAVMEISVFSEPSLATERAIIEAERSAKLLGLYSPHCTSINTKSHCKIYGSGDVESVTCYQVYGDYGFIGSQKSVSVDTAEGNLWILDQGEMKWCKERNFEVVSKLLREENLCEYEQTVLNSLLIYSRAAFTSDAMEKLVFTLSALESFLLKNKSEPIQQNLADRFAYYITRTPEYRASLVSEIKEVYAIRSDYLHHGLNSNESKKLMSFFTQVFGFYYVVLSNINQFSSKKDFFDFIDRLKYS